MVSGEIPMAMMVTSLWLVKLLLLSLLPALATASTVTTAMIKMMLSTSLSRALMPFLALVALNGMLRTIPILRIASAPWVTALLLVSEAAPVEAAVAALLAHGKATVLVLPVAVTTTALMT